MRICNAYHGIALVGMLAFAGHAFALDPKSINANTSPQEALQEGLDLYKQGQKQSAFDALNFAAEKGDPVAQWQAIGLPGQLPQVTLDYCSSKVRGVPATFVGSFPRLLQSLSWIL